MPTLISKKITDLATITSLSDNDKMLVGTPSDTYNVEFGTVKEDAQTTMVQKNWGSENVGRFLVVGADGNVGLVDSGSSTITLQEKTVIENGIVTPDVGYDGLSRVVVNVQGGAISGFELYAGDSGGGARSHKGVLDNQYFVCYFDDNMSSTYTLNGQSYTFSTISIGKQQTLGATMAVNNNEAASDNAIIGNGSLFTASHGDSGSYISVVGGWVGYPTGGTIFESGATGTSNSITLDAAYSKLLVFIGACFNSDGVTSVEINGTTCNITNIGYHYGAYGVFGAIEIDNNSDTTITANFSLSGWSYMSIIGIRL